MLGDFNYPEINWLNQSLADNASLDCKDFFSGVNDSFITQHVLVPTRGDATLDLIFSREPELVSDVKVLENLGSSDHNMVTCTIHHQCDTHVSHRQVRDYNRGNYDSIRSELEEINWDEFMCGEMIPCWDRFKKLLLELEQKYIPLKKTPRRNHSNKPIWMTNKALKSIERKSKVFRKYKRHDHPAVKAANSTAVRELKRAKHNFEKKLAQNIKQDSKSFFAYVRSKAKSKTQAGALLSERNDMLNSDKDIAERFNQYFSSVFTSEDLSNIPTPVTVLDGLVQCTDLQFDVNTVTKALLKLRPDKSMGPDGLAPRLLLETKELISYPLCLLFRKSLDETSIPDDWKQATVTPIFKKGNRNQAENYRPVSLTSVIGKLFESIIRDNLVHYLESNTLITNTQHGFRKGRSCLTNLLEFLDKVTGCVDSGECVDVVFLDFAKAFDKVPLKRLMVKIRSHGVTGKIAQWIEEWLRNRVQRVGIRGTLSEWIMVLSGVPQGSVLGPLLFLIFINDLEGGIKNWILKFADDTKIFSRVNNDTDRERLQQDLHKLTSWSTEWQMLFNVSKCKFMHIGKTSVQYSYSMNNKQLELVKEERDLGVLITSDLKVSQQCQGACNKALRMLGLIHRTIEFKHPDILLRLYKSLVRPHVEYCVVAWAPYYVKDKEMIERVQRRFTRMIPSIRKLPYEERLAALGLWSLEDRRLRADLIEVYKMTHGLSSIDFNTFFEFCHNTRTRGHSLKLHKNRVQTDLRQHFFTERIINVWNKMDEETVSATSMISFKGRLQKLHKDGSFPRLLKSA